MSDPLPTGGPDPRDAASTSARTSTIERLLVSGLDRYFGGEYQQAINVWTRALFLDRTHPRARAYIERARSALAERQRESDELLQQGIDAFERGDGSRARVLVHDALERGAHRDEALAVLHRLDRLDRVNLAGDRATPGGGRVLQVPRAADRPRLFRASRWTFAVMAGVTAIAIWARGVAPAWRAEHVAIDRRSDVVVSDPRPHLPVPTRAERALERGQMLAAGGRLHDALAALELVRPTDTQKNQADRLRAHIQRQLIALALGNAVEPLPQDVLRP